MYRRCEDERGRKDKYMRKERDGEGIRRITEEKQRNKEGRDIEIY